LTLDEGGTEALRRCIVRVSEMLGVDAIAMGSVTDTIAIDADITSFWDPARGDSAKLVRKTINIQSGSAAVVINLIQALVTSVSSSECGKYPYIASQATTVLGITNEENTLDGVEGSAGQLGKSIDSGSGALRVAFEDEAFVRVGSKSRCNVVHDL